MIVCSNEQTFLFYRHKIPTFMTHLLSINSNWFARQHMICELVALVAVRKSWINLF